MVILEVSGSNPGWVNRNLDRGVSWFFSVLLRENSGTAARLRHDHFQLLFNSSFTKQTLRH